MTEENETPQQEKKRIAKWYALLCSVFGLGMILALGLPPISTMVWITVGWVVFGVVTFPIVHSVIKRKPEEAVKAYSARVKEVSRVIRGCLILGTLGTMVLMLSSVSDFVFGFVIFVVFVTLIGAWLTNWMFTKIK